MAGNSKSSAAPVSKAAADPAPPSPGAKVRGIRVTSKIAGFRRAGRAWSTVAEDVPVSAFSKAQVAQLKAEPMLSVTEIDLDAPDA